MPQKAAYYHKCAPFLCEGKKQFVAVEDSRQTVRRRVFHSNAIVDEVVCRITRSGCAIEDIGTSPSGEWIVTQRFSGQGEWGYDVIRTCPLKREAGTPEADGYMLDLPMFSTDETRLIGGFGANWLGGWWAHADDDYEEPSRGGVIAFGFLFVHQLPSHKVKRHTLRMKLPKGWLPKDPDAETWLGARAIGPADEGEGARLTLPGGVAVEIEGPLPSVILLPTPHPSGKRLLSGTTPGVKLCPGKR
ncbi:MAG: hypothetical protein K8T89_04455 [Planctomycetes bacterium]|nr:hypothetical protein [Planctomycetota bacterium]